MRRGVRGGVGFEGGADEGVHSGLAGPWGSGWACSVAGGSCATL